MQYLIFLPYNVIEKQGCQLEVHQLLALALCTALLH